jgi:2-oxo-4-hydroxy-4-carboxy-5-ureidoimidazoline decarboxylase
MMRLCELDRNVLLECCGSARWVDGLLASRPFETEDELFLAAREIWWNVEESDWLEAFSKHPQIGARQTISAWSSQEQAGMNHASASTTDAIEALNHEYLEKFGWIFIVCATGKSADEMRAAIEKRLGNGPYDEIRIAAGEQAKIMQIRLRRLLEA